jgi:manganese transport protein
LPFAIIPLVAFAGNRRLMGRFVLGPMTTACGWTMAMLVLTFNAVLIWQWRHRQALVANSICC